MEMYRSLLSDITVKYCEAGKRHLHFVEERQVTEQSQICQFVVEVWDYERKIKIIAKAFVRKHKISPYVLCSGYRKRNFTDNALHQEIVKRLNAKIFIKKDPNNPYGTKMTLIADHSGLTE
jgi:hypothetical protein